MVTSKLASCYAFGGRRCSQFVLFPAGANREFQHCSNQISIVLLSAVWER